MRLLLPALGVNVFASDVPALPGHEPKPETVFELNWEEAHGECVVRDGQYVVLAGSTARVKEVDSLGNWGRNIRKKLLDMGVLLPDPGNDQLLRFAQQYAFDSPSGAAAAVSGTGLNGRAHWKLQGSGLTLKEWQEQQVGSEDAAEDED